MFDFSNEFDLEICQPSFRLESKISHIITKQLQANSIGRYTNFIEVNTPLMTKKSIQNLDSVYDHSLIGWGIDFLFIWINNNRQIPYIPCKKFAINDKVCCINPYDREMGKEGRELNKISGFMTREQCWKSYAKTISCPAWWEPISLGPIQMPFYITYE